MNRFIIGALVIAARLMADGDWSVSADWLALSRGGSPSYGFYNQGPSHLGNLRESIDFSGRVQLGYCHGVFRVDFSHLFALASGLRSEDLQFSSIETRSVYQHPKLELGFVGWLWRFAFGLRAAGHFLHHSCQLDYVRPPSDSVTRELAVHSWGVNALGGGLGASIHFEAWGGLGLGGSIDFAGYGGRPEMETLSGSTDAQLRRWVPGLGAEADVYVQHQYRGENLGVTLRVGALAQGVALDAFETSEDELLEVVGLTGVYLRAGLLF